MQERVKDIDLQYESGDDSDEGILSVARDESKVAPEAAIVFIAKRICEHHLTNIARGFPP